MYLGKYPDSGGLPPGYNGVAYAPIETLSEPAETEPPLTSAAAWPAAPDNEAEQDFDADSKQTFSGPPEAVAGQHQPLDSPENHAHKGGFLDGILGHLFSHKIDMEDLLLIGLIVMLINSKADLDLIIMLALLFVMGL